MKSKRTLDDLTHLWLEAPLFPETLAMLPESITVIDADPGLSSPLDNAAPAQVIIASSRVEYDGAAMDRLPNLAMIARTGIGVDNVNLADATERGIVVTNTPDGPTESTAEHTVAMLLALAKSLKHGNNNLAAGQFGPRKAPLIGTEVMGKTLGLGGPGAHRAPGGGDLPPRAQHDDHRLRSLCDGRARRPDGCGAGRSGRSDRRR